MAKVAFELRADQAENFSAGSTSLPGGKTYNVGEALQAGNGKITLNPDSADRKDQDAQEKENRRAKGEVAIIEALDRFPALKRTTVGSTSSSDKSESKGGNS